MEGVLGVLKDFGVAAADSSVAGVLGGDGTVSPKN
jgi:hypothetical protein